ncbi:MAG TPA: M66 family metalloprotease [Polyangiaceae bacterium]
MQSNPNFRSAPLWLLVAALGACTGNIEGDAPPAALAMAPAGGGASSLAGGPALLAGGSSGSAGGGSASISAPEPAPWSGMLGSWCGPGDDSTLWLVAGPQQPPTSSCELASSKLYPDNADGIRGFEDTADGLTLELDRALLAALPALQTAPARYCQNASCSDVQVSLTLESYTEGQGAKGSWSFTLPGQAELKGRLEASWCGWDDLLPAHPEGERLARDIRIRELSVYQGVKVPIVRDMLAVAQRNADLVQDREAMVRVFVEPQSGFQSRELLARLTLQDEGAAPRRFEANVSVSGASREDDGSTTFNIPLPKDAFKQGTQYSLELREISKCTPLPGTPVGARFPETGLAAVGARATGPVKVMLVPVRYEADGSGRLPDTSPEQLAKMTARLYSMYPTSGVVLSMHDVVGTSRTDLEDMLDQMRQLRDTDEPPSDLAYYGLVRQAETFREYCQGSCTTGIAGFGSQDGAATAGMGIGYPDTAVGTFVHELGHVYRRPHAPCGGAAGADEQYPYPEGKLGSWGFDFQTRELFDPATHVDFMSYCSPEWISDYNYQQLLERIVVVNGSAVQRRVAAPGPRRVYRTLMVDARGQTRWGLELRPRFAPPGDTLTIDVLDEAGSTITQVTAYQEDNGDGRRSLFIPAPSPGWHAVRAPGLPAIDYAGTTDNVPFTR